MMGWDGNTITPDNTTTETNVSGKLQIKDLGVSTDKLADDAVTLAKMAAGTAGNLITFDASGNPAAIATGTAGQVLTSNGAGAAPTFQTSTSGEGWTLLTTLNPSGVANISSGALAAHTEYKVRITNLSTSANSNLQMRLNADTGNNYGARWIDNGAFGSNDSQSYALIYAPGASFATSFCSGELLIPGKTRAVASGIMWGSSGISFATGGGHTYSWYWYGGNNTQVSSVTFISSSGTMTGKIEIYGRTPA